MSAARTDRSGARGAELAMALLAGTVFGLGLAISGMANPAKVLAFLDVAGAWDPTLAVVMAGALLVATPLYRVVLARQGPWFAPRFVLPAAVRVDARLVVGSALFGVGWGLSGLCPGPAVTDLVAGEPAILIFVAAMLAGAVLARLLERPAPQGGSATS